jgi:hypothetical protein
MQNAKWLAKICDICSGMGVDYYTAVGHFLAKYGMLNDKKVKTLHEMWYYCVHPQIKINACNCGLHHE